MIKEQGEDAECAAWIYTKNDCHLKDEDGEIDYNNNVEDPALLARIFDDVGNIDYIYQVIQESVDEVVEEQLMQYHNSQCRALSVINQSAADQLARWHKVSFWGPKSCIVDT